MQTLKQKKLPLLLLGGVLIATIFFAYTYKTPEQTQGSSVEDFSVECRTSSSTTMNLTANVPSIIASTSPQRHRITFHSSTTDNPEAIWLNKGTLSQAAPGKGEALYGTSSKEWDSSVQYTGIITAVSKVNARLVVEDCSYTP